jgi:hypothetical protein
MYIKYSHTTNGKDNKPIDWYCLYNSSGYQTNYVSFSSSQEITFSDIPFDDPLDIIEAGLAIQRYYGTMISDLGTALNNNLLSKNDHLKLINNRKK